MTQTSPLLDRSLEIRTDTEKLGRINKLISTAGSRLKTVGIKAGDAEAEIVLCYLLAIDRLKLFLDGADLLTLDLEKRFWEIVTRRETRYPLQYILGEAWFYGRRFEVNENVMVPTPETELLCEVALRFIRFREIKAPRILDIGTGSGVVCATMVLECPGAQITALDISGEALEVARSNSKALGAENIKFLESDLFGTLDKNSRFDLILSNPPYIAEYEYDVLPPEVLADPKISLISGAEGLDIIERLISDSPDYLAPEGKLIFEIGYNQTEAINILIDANVRYRSSVLMRDLNDIDRVVILSPARPDTQ
ncbi:MAG: peptide chain release factor N(5)-glutamine methyltransferase [candidate division Zixibacteria bacterium]|nr:peptide chain release factor N(5)-glutamine methyltransferase [candidate division Zixibacteria bacterium]